MKGKASGLLAVLLAGMLAACAAPAPRGTVGQSDPGQVSDENLLAAYAGEESGPSAAVPLAEESEAATARPEPGRDRPDPQEAAVISDRTRTGVEGALVGALIGGLAGGFGFGGTQAALIGAALGAGAGYVVADQIAKRKEQYASEEEFLDSEIEMAAEFNETAALYNDQLRAEIAALNSSTEALLLQYQQGQIALDAIDAKRIAVQQKIEETDKIRQDLEQEYEVKLAVYDEQKEKRGETDAYLGSLARELNQLDQNIRSHKNGSLELAQIEDKLTV